MNNTPLINRSARRVPAIVLGLLLTALGVVTVWGAVERLITGSYPGWLESGMAWLQSLSWGSIALLITSIVLGFVGLCLLITALSPGAATGVAVKPLEQGESVQASDVMLSRSAVSRVSGAAADLVDGVDKVSVSAGSRKVHLDVTTAATNPEAVKAKVVEQVSQRLAAINVSPAPRVTASVHQ